MKSLALIWVMLALTAGILFVAIVQVAVWSFGTGTPYVETAPTEFRLDDGSPAPRDRDGTLLVERGTSLTVIRHFCLAVVQRAVLVRTVTREGTQAELHLTPVDLVDGHVRGMTAGTREENDKSVPLPYCGQDRNLLPVFASTAPGRYHYIVDFEADVNPIRYARYRVSDVWLRVLPGAIERRLESHEEAERALDRRIGELERKLAKRWWER